MSECSKWITDRQPTKDDCNKYTDGVLAWNKDGSVVIAWHDKIEPEQPWMPLPEPYVPPEPQFTDGSTPDPPIP